MTPLILANPTCTPHSDQPPEVQAAMIDCYKAGARVEYADPNDPDDPWEICAVPRWASTVAYRIWPAVGEVRDWRGGPCPVPEGATVTVWLRGELREAGTARTFEWLSGFGDDDIIRYRVDAMPQAAPVADDQPGFATSGAEARYIEDMANACPACGGSGHKDDAVATLANMQDHATQLADLQQRFDLLITAMKIIASPECGKRRAVAKEALRRLK